MFVAATVLRIVTPVCLDHRNKITKSLTAVHHLGCQLVCLRVFRDCLGFFLRVGIQGHPAHLLDKYAISRAISWDTAASCRRLVLGCLRLLDDILFLEDGLQLAFDAMGRRKP